MSHVPACPDVAAGPHSVDVGLLVRRTHGLLAAGVPLTLLLDLSDPAGPRSHARFAAEQADLAWIPQPAEPG